MALHVEQRPELHVDRIMKLQVPGKDDAVEGRWRLKTRSIIIFSAHDDHESPEMKTCFEVDREYHPRKMVNSFF